MIYKYFLFLIICLLCISSYSKGSIDQCLTTSSTGYFLPTLSTVTTCDFVSVNTETSRPSNTIILDETHAKLILPVKVRSKIVHEIKQTARNQMKVDDSWIAYIPTVSGLLNNMLDFKSSLGSKEHGRSITTHHTGYAMYHSTTQLPLASRTRLISPTPTNSDFYDDFDYGLLIQKTPFERARDLVFWLYAPLNMLMLYFILQRLDHSDSVIYGILLHLDRDWQSQPNRYTSFTGARPPWANPPPEEPTPEPENERPLDPFFDPSAEFSITA